jgi:hypothetical protein
VGILLQRPCMQTPGSFDSGSVVVCIIISTQQHHTSSACTAYSGAAGWPDM